MDKPEWFERALSAGQETGSVDVEGTNICYSAWGERGKPGLVLIHGSNAHREWWRFVAPFLADQFRVAALDLSGNGDSGWRERYSGELFASEVMAVCEAAGLGERPMVVGHSFGGWVALETAHYHGSRLGGVLFCDYTVPPPGKHEEWGLRAQANGPARATRVYDDYATALGRFRLMPEQPCQHPYVIDYVGRQSLREVEGGWTWKFDPALFDYLQLGPDQFKRFASLACRAAYLLGEHSEDYDQDNVAALHDLTAGMMPIYPIPATYHHYMFDEPMAVVAAIKGIAMTWLASDHSEALRNRLQQALS